MRLQRTLVSNLSVLMDGRVHPRVGIGHLPDRSHPRAVVVRLDGATKLSLSTAVAERRTNNIGKMREGGVSPRWTFLGSPEAVGFHHLPIVVIVVVGR